VQKETLPDPSSLRRRPASVLADRRFHGVLLVWALCCLALLLCVGKFGGSLPWADEWGFTSVALGRQSLSWSWLWEANNEHRQPLMRLGLVVIGRLGHWDWQAMHYVTLTLMGLGALALLCAARSIRGHSALSDTFLCLVVLSPGQFETTWTYAYSFGAAGGLICIALSLAAIRWPQRSLKHLILYLLTVLVITLSGGPTGNLLAFGLVGALAPLLWETTSRAWKISAEVGSGLVLAVSGALLAFTPSIPQNTNFLSNSLTTTVKATLKESVCWLGPPVLSALWPWAFLIVLLPGLWVVRRILRDLLCWRRGNPAPAREWMDLVLVWLATFLVAACIAYGRAGLGLWSYRYMVLTMPIGIILYLLLVRMRAPLAIPHTLAVVSAIFCGWNWPVMLFDQTARLGKMTELVQTLERGDIPLCEVCRQRCADVGLLPSNPSFIAHLTNCMIELRQSDLSIFRRINRRKQRDGMALPQAWKADSGKLDNGWVCLPDENATQGRTLRVSAAGERSALAAYHVQVAVGGLYQLCCRMRAPQRQTLTVMVDGRQFRRETFPATAEFRPCMLTTPLELKPGQHNLTLTLSPPCSDLDLLELVPQSRANAPWPLPIRNETDLLRLLLRLSFSFMRLTQVGA
jgi:hypothetical protein